jgi:hypothetical protein
MFQYDAIAIEDINIYRHWHPASEAYAGGDSLATALYLGWTMVEIVYREEHWRAGRCSMVFHVTLERDGETMVMPVISNPYVRRFLNESPVQIVPFEQREQVRQPRRNSNA